MTENTIHEDIRARIAPLQSAPISFEDAISLIEIGSPKTPKQIVSVHTTPELEPHVYALIKHAARDIAILLEENDTLRQQLSDQAEQGNDQPIRFRISNEGASPALTAEEFIRKATLFGEHMANATEEAPATENNVYRQAADELLSGDILTGFSKVQSATRLYTLANAVSAALIGMEQGADKDTIAAILKRGMEKAEMDIL